MKRLWWVVTLSLALLFVVGGSIQAQQPQTYPIMHPDEAAWDRWMAAYESDPLAYIDPNLIQKSLVGGSLSLLSHLQYTPSERNQSNCGNCWVWAGTGLLEVALDVQTGNKVRLSEQFLNSCASGSCACDGGYLALLTSFYAGKKFVIPWSNTGANWQDGAGSCSVECSTISTSPNYPLSSITANTISTRNVGAANAITNIKNVLDQGKAVDFSFYLPNQADWNSFFSFWNTKAETDVWNYSPCADPYGAGSGGHAVLCVGYDDTDPNNRYWLILNSWGTTSHRPDGLFRVSMDINYDCMAPYLTQSRQAFTFETVAVTFSGSAAVNAPSNLVATAASQTQINLTWTDNSTNESDFHVERSATGSAPWTEIGTSTSASYNNTGLTCNTRYYYRVRAHRHSDGQYSAYSNTANATTQACAAPTAPSNLVATAASQVQINLTWTDNSADESDFHVERSATGSAPWTEIGTSTSASYNNTGLTCNTRYYYRVRAHRHSDGQYSAYSNTANATTQGCSGTCSAVDSLSCSGYVDWNNGKPGSTDLIDSYPCSPWNESGPEYTYTFVPCSTGPITVTLSDLSADLDIFVLDGAGGSCSAGGCLAYGDNSASFYGQAGHTYYVVVDGYGGAVSDYRLGVQRSGSGQSSKIFLPMVVKGQ